jgi:hypothetical protein
MARSHQRKLIREAVRAQLAAAGTSAEARVFKARVLPLDQDLELPALTVYGKDEDVDPDSKSTAPRELARTLKLAIEGSIAVTEDLDDRLDDLAAEIEAAVDKDPTFGRTASDAILSGTLIGMDTSGDQPIGVVILTYSVTYYTQAPDAEDVRLDDLRTVDTHTSLGGAQATADQAEDRVTVPTT